jgi:Aromatic-ring-opening dioxygenase LigAB, LigA subunit
MSASAFEAFLARIYVDPDARARFKADPCAEASHAGLSPDECAAIMRIDWVGLELAARSFAKKRRAKARRPRPSFRARIQNLFFRTLDFFR